MSMDIQTSIDRSSPVWKMRQCDCIRRQATIATFSDVPLADPSQHFMLFFIERGSDHGILPSQRDIAENMRLSPATVTASLKAMEKYGLICRTPDKADMRINRVAITNRGRTVAAECRRRMDYLEEQMFRDFSPEELMQLTRYFERMACNLKSMCGKEGPVID